MKQTIRFKGLSLNRDEQSAEPGELSLCGDMQLYDGALRPAVLTGKNVAGGNTIGGKLIYIHQTANREVFLFNDSGMLNYSYENGSAWATAQTISITGFAINNMVDIKSNGNTLCVMTDKGIWYILWDAAGNKYNALGQQPPFIELQFNLINSERGDRDRNKEEYDLSVSEGDWWGVGSGHRGIKESVRGSVTEQVMAAVNKRIDSAVGNGRFYAPFLIRYCYKMFDGSMIMHSAPVLMMPMLHHPVITWINNEDISKRHTVGDGTYKFCVYLKECILQSRCLNTNIATNLKKWSDVISSIEIFITPQFSRIDTASMIDNIVSSSNYTGENVSLIEGSLVEFVTTDFDSIYDISDVGADAQRMSFALPEYDEDEYFKRIRSASTFYMVKSVDLENAFSTFTQDLTDLDINTEGIKNVTVQKQMTDDYKTHNLLLPSSPGNGGMYVYNHRLNVYDISEELFYGFSPGILFPYINVGININRTDVFINTNVGIIKRTYGGTNTSVYLSEWLIKNGFCFYPDSRGAYIEFKNAYTETWYTRRLDDHETLNGAVAFMNGLESSRPTGNGNISQVPMTNKIYTSRADNPFYFPNLPGESGINTVGVGEIIGLAVATRALSAGQVGDHDLIAFCSDGIWVLKVSAQGTYSQIHNISREVCVNKDSICQLDQSVVFATNRSLSRFVESDVISISEILDGPYAQLKNLLPGLYSNVNTNAKNIFDFTTPPIDFFKSGLVFYDYTASRIIVLPKNMAQGGVSLVFSTRDKAWSMMNVPGINGVVSGYPSMCIQFSTGKVVRLSTPYNYNDANAHSGIIVTRTLTFSDTMDVLRGFRQMSDLNTMPTLFFYGSNNQRTWQLIGQTAREFHNYLPGHPFRFFRIAIYFTGIKTSEEYQELILEVVNKYAKL